VTQHVVIFDETGEERTVRGVCRRCYRCGELVSELSVAELQVVSPMGIAHYANEYGDTDCGRNATREGWWWKL